MKRKVSGLSVSAELLDGERIKEGSEIKDSSTAKGPGFFRLIEIPRQASSAIKRRIFNRSGILFKKNIRKLKYAHSYSKKEKTYFLSSSHVRSDMIQRGRCLLSR